MRRFTPAVLALTGCLLLIGCSKEDPIPEERDPIFKDLEHRQSEHQKTYDEATAKLKELYASLEKAEPNSLEKRDIQRDIAKYKAQALDNEQWARYYRIRTGRRKLVDRLAYKEALGAKKPWPDPSEYSEYLVNRRLVEANRNWNARVPKLRDRLPSSAKADTKKKKEKAGGEE
jgi:hypothetical protein